MPPPGIEPYAPSRRAHVERAAKPELRHDTPHAVARAATARAPDGLAAFRALGGFTGASRLSTWLHRIVVNAALMRLRTRRRRREESIEELLPRFDDAGGWAEPASGWDTTVEARLERAEVRRHVREGIDRLPENYRTVLLLRDIEELDTDETAVLLGITANAVKTRLHRARQALRTLLARRFAGA